MNSYDILSRTVRDGEMAQKSLKIVVVEGEDFIGLLGLSKKAEFNLKNDPVDSTLPADQRADQMTWRGAVLTDVVANDGTVIPAIQRINVDTGAILYAKSFKNGEDGTELAAPQLDVLNARRVQLLLDATTVLQRPLRVSRPLVFQK